MPYKFRCGKMKDPESNGALSQPTNATIGTFFAKSERHSNGVNLS